MSQPDISEYVLAILERLGADPDDIRAITITLDAVIFEVYLRNEHGKKYVDTEGNPAFELRRMDVKTTVRKRVFV